MVSEYTILHQENHETSQARFAKDVFLGLMRTQKVLSSKYMYDTEGSKLYEKIMNLEEYYLVNAEFNTLTHAKRELSYVLGKGKFNLIELGAGNAYKTKILLEQFLSDNLDFTYTPIDISEPAMKRLVASLNTDFPKLTAHGLVADYFDALNYLEDQRENEKNIRNVILFLGSNIGNFSFEDAVDFIFSLWRSLKYKDYVLIGFDLRKDIDLMIEAYNDKDGITSTFNLNVLERINRELGGQFDITKFKHYEPYNVRTGAMESYLISLEDQEIYIEKFDRTFQFKKWEPIFMEHSYKYSVEDIRNLAKITGFTVENMFYDEKRYFINSLWCVKSPDK
ncbi:MAG: L-histidine N(alpha)-methyltransferase [Candidatus Kariarchaeaceae archaeon]